MQLHHLLAKSLTPEAVVAQGFDCVWVAFLGQSEASPLKDRLVQWIDWRMQGVISKYVVAGDFAEKHPTFVPTLGKQPFQYLVLDPNSPPSRESFAKHCSGIRARKVLLLCENEDAVDRYRKELSGKNSVKAGADDLEIHLVIGSA